MLRRYLAREIENWTKNGLLEPGQGAALLADHDRRHSGFSLSGVLGVLAAVLFGAAVIALVAANWELIARPLRVAMIVAMIVVGLAIAVVARRRDFGWIAEAALVFTLLSYGAGIALVGQMYHLSGDEAAFMLAWTIGALVVALSFSSAFAAISAGLLGLGYFFAEAEIWGRAVEASNATVYLHVPLVAIAIAAAALRTESKVAGHLAALLVVGWAMWLFTERFGGDPGDLLAVLGAIAFASGSLVPTVYQRLGGPHGVASAYGTVMLLAGLGVIQGDLSGDNLALEIAMAVLILGASVAVLAIAGRDNQSIRRFAYVAFAAETIYVVGETLGSLIGSSGFLFLGGLTLAIIAYLVMRVERRFSAKREQT